MINILRRWVAALLFPRPLVGLLYLPAYVRDWRRFKTLAGRNALTLEDSHPCLTDRVASTPFDPHYFYQGAWLARQLAQQRPSSHVDIGSSVLTMSVLSAIVDTVFVDYRPLRTALPGLSAVAGDIAHLPFGTGAVASLSCLHVIEHIGLGRYGDPVDPEGSVKAAQELQRVLMPGGQLYLSVPIGRERVCFNAHRVFAPATIMHLFAGLTLTDFAYVDDAGKYVPDARPDASTALDYGCGLFVFQKT